MQNLRVFLLLAALSGLFLLVGFALGGRGGMTVALVMALAMNVGSFWFSDTLVLRMTRAQPVAPQQAPALHALTARLAERAGIPMPRLFVVPDPQPNAFATGRNPSRGVVAVNQGLLDLLSEREVEGVIAHEIAHIKYRDTRTMAIVAALASATMTLVQFGGLFGASRDDREGGGVHPVLALGLLLLAPLAAMLVQAGISREREFEADAEAARLQGTPDGLIGALQKLHAGAARIPSATARPATAHLNIVNPLAGQRLAGMFSTHPPLEARVDALRRLGASPARPA